MLESVVLLYMKFNSLAPGICGSIVFFQTHLWIEISITYCEFDLDECHRTQMMMAWC